MLLNYILVQVFLTTRLPQLRVLIIKFGEMEFWQEAISKGGQTGASGLEGSDGEDTNRNCGGGCKGTMEEGKQN